MPDKLYSVVWTDKILHIRGRKAMQEEIKKGVVLKIKRYEEDIGWVDITTETLTPATPPLKLRFTKKKGDKSSIRKVWDTDKVVCFGVVGTVRDLRKAAILSSSDYPGNTWVFLPSPGKGTKAWFGGTREEALSDLKEELRNDE